MHKNDVIQMLSQIGYYTYYTDKSLVILKRMRPNNIQIASSTGSAEHQEVITPQWAVSDKKLTSFPKMSRLDELLCRNQQIYQNMRHQLQQITRSNQNIDVNINNIKPYYESGGYGDQVIQDNQNQSNNDNRNSYTFQNKQQVLSDRYSNEQTNRSQMQRAQKIHISSSTKISKNNSQYLNPDFAFEQGPQKIIRGQNTVSNQKIISKWQPSYHQDKKISYRVPSIGQSTNSFHEMDSSPIQSQGHISQSIRVNTSDKLSSDRSKLKSNFLYEDLHENSKRYQTFEQQNESLQKVDETQQYVINKQNLIQNNLNYEPAYEKQQQLQNVPLAMLSLVYIPFNRLYSSPILQQIGKRQLVLARKSKTQIISNSAFNKIVNGIKYKNVNLCTEETDFYDRVMGQVRMCGRRKQVNIGIVGARNSLKKKLHYGLLAHVYEYILVQINKYFNDSLTKSKPPNLIFTIEHQQQFSLNQPQILSLSISLSTNQPQNSISLRNMQALIQQIFDSMRNKYPVPNNTEQQKNINCIRVTRLTLEYIRLQNGQRILQKLNNIKIISTNKIQMEFVQELGLDVSVWCVNPLVRYHGQTMKVLECFAGLREKWKNRGNS